MTLAQITSKALRSLDNNSPVILTGLAVAGVVSTAIFAGKATAEAAKKIQESENTEVGLRIKKTPQERAQLVWRLYLPAAGMGLATVACIIGAQSINSRRQAALISGFTIAETSLREYRDKVVELEGSKTDQKVRDAVAQDRVTSDAASNELVIIGSGNVLCYDMYTGRYFESQMEKIRAAQNSINEIIITDMYCSLNDFYRMINLPPTKMGEQLGWSIERMLDLNFSSTLTEDGRPCLAMDFRAEPMQDYYKLR